MEETINMYTILVRNFLLHFHVCISFVVSFCLYLFLCLRGRDQL